MLPRVAALVAIALIFAPPASATPTSRGPVGWDVYRRLDRLPELHFGARTLQVSSHDRSGGNDDGYFGTYSCLRTVAEGCLLAEHDGPGQIENLWFTRDFGNLRATGEIKIRLDGRTVLRGQLEEVVGGTLGAPFSFPLVADASQTSGGAFVRVPMPFRRSMRVTTENNPGYYSVTYRSFPSARGVTRFDPRQEAPDVLKRLSSAGTADPKPAFERSTSTTRRFAMAPGAATTLTRLRGSGAIGALGLRLRGLEDAALSAVLRKARLRLRFDGRRTVDAPLGEFFGSGLGVAPVRSLFFAMGPSAQDWLTSWWPMPYARSASVTLVNRSDIAVRRGELSVEIRPSRRWQRALRQGRAGYFHAAAKAPSVTRPGRDWNFLDVSGAGRFVGVTQTMRGGSPEYYLEGDERAYVDGEGTPRFHGTGTEDFYGGGWYFTSGFKSRPFTLPLNGFPKELDRSTGCRLATCKTAYRVLLGDALPFRSSLRFGIEHGGENEIEAIYSSTAYWYQRRLD